MLFIKNYLDGHALHQSATSAGLEYRHTSVNWASYVREVCREYVYNANKTLVFGNEVEIDESLFGAKMKYHKEKSKGHTM